MFLTFFTVFVEKMTKDFALCNNKKTLLAVLNDCYHRYLEKYFVINLLSQVSQPCNKKSSKGLI